MKKYGTFGGVFTPSILTILGVIMYMRLPWIIGSAGITVTIGIILVAHIVSITTGLSISSIATDKKVEGGGTYYIISRSLGLPIGGMLGFALFVGLSLSVSLYLIGFSESFLAFWNIPVTKNAIRLVGTLGLISVGTLTFISTSLAMKAQYFIMAAIIGSLLTVLFGKPIHLPEQALWAAPETMGSLIVLFAVFFPAVTGFEAGVSMSGDLKDSKKSIPFGTIAAIMVGLIVYIGLTIFLGSFINADQLVNNPNVLLEISRFTPLLAAGIWGATLSSAIGSILGAPRIFQAMALDKIVPYFFAKGYGKTLEPRNALLLTFILAETGILIGELNLIARIVAMFFITAYGFLNLSCTLEKWASPDFRPSFKVPYFVSILGAATCFILMIELDFVAFIISSVLMGAIYFYLKRKELILDTGDTWEGIWSSFLRLGLDRLTRIRQQQRNWRPNILLFTPPGEHSTVRHFAQDLIHKRGLLSHFELIEKAGAHFQKKQATKEPPGHSEGVFTQRMEVSNFYQDMTILSQIYGFSGLEPNSIMLHMPGSNAQNHFFETLKTFIKNDYNLFVVQSHSALSAHQSIDCWWGGATPNIHFALTLLKFLQSSPRWERAQIRILIAYEHSIQKEFLEKYTLKALQENRVQADIKLVNHSARKTRIEDLIAQESYNTDLVLLGLPEMSADTFAPRIESLSHALKNILWIKASSFFQQKDPVYLPQPVEVSASVLVKYDSEPLFSEEENLKIWEKQVYKGLCHVQNQLEDLLKHEYYPLIIETQKRWHQMATASFNHEASPDQLHKRKGQYLHEALTGAQHHQKHTLAHFESLYQRLEEKLFNGFDALIMQCPENLNKAHYRELCRTEILHLQQAWSKNHLERSAKEVYGLQQQIRTLFLQGWDQRESKEAVDGLSTATEHFSKHVDQVIFEIHKNGTQSLRQCWEHIHTGLISQHKQHANVFKKLQKENPLIERSSTFLTHAQWVSNSTLKEIWLKQIQFRLRGVLKRTLQDIQVNEPKPAATKQQNIKPFYLQSHFTSLVERFQTHVKDLPENFNVLQDDAYEALLEDPLTEREHTSIDFKKHVNFLLEKELINPLERLFHHHEEKVNQRIKQYYYLQSLDQHPENSSDSESLANKYQEVLDQLQADSASFHKEGMEIFENASEKITPYLLTHGQQVIESSLQRKKAENILDLLKAQWSQKQNKASDLLSQIVEKKSESILLAQKLYDQEQHYRSPLGQLSHWSRLMNPFSPLEKELPYHYRKLHSSNSLGELSFWQSPELKSIYQEVEHFQYYQNGGLLILGEQQSGKSTLSHHLSRYLQRRNNILHLYAPKQGGTQIAEQMSLWLNEQALKQGITLTDKTTLILHDLERWWERSPEGHQRFEQVLRELAYQAQQRLLIANMNINTYRFLRQITTLDQLFIHSVTCPLFSAKQIRRILENKQAAAHINWSLTDSNEKTSQFKTSQFFNRIFELSEGHIGLAHAYWIAHIANYKDQHIQLKKLSLPDADKYLSALSHNQCLLLQQTILHHEMSVAQLKRLSGVALGDEIIPLTQVGLLQETRSGQWRIKDTLYLPIVKHLKTKDYL